MDGVSVVTAPPPNFAKIAAVFPEARRDGVIFTFGRTIFNPSNAKITRELAMHEAVHGERQGEQPLAWWDRYLEDAEFRLAEELQAHALEYYGYCRRHGDLKKRARYLDAVAARLSGPLYGGLLTFERARHMIVCGGHASA